MMYTLYILQCHDGSYYTGIARDLEKRLRTHALGKGSRYVRSRLPFKLVYTEKKRSRSSALKREHEIKHLTRTEKIGLIRGLLKPEVFN